MSVEMPLPTPTMAPTSARILVVDDNELNRDLARNRLSREGFEVIEAINGRVALEFLRHEQVDLILLDVMMPELDGPDTLAAIKGDERLRHIPIIMVSAVTEMETIARCIAQGADDYLHKPFNPVLLKARVYSSLERKRVYDQEQVRQMLMLEEKEALEHRLDGHLVELAAAQQAAIFAMSKLAESKDPETGAHLERMREYCRVLSRELAARPRYGALIDEAFIDTIYAASPLHDIGKVGVPDQILLKPGKLDAGEWRQMQTHTLIGGSTLRAVDAEYPGNEFIQMGIAIAECHHEKWDGSGYPKGLSGEQIPLAARILALGDVYDALTSRRCYKEAFSHEQSRGILLEQSGRHFDPEVVEAFLACEGEFIAIRRRFEDDPQ